MPAPLVLDTTTAESTRAVAEAIASLLRRGDVLALSGDLGAGKTTFVQGLARGLGVGEPVSSPTFVLVRRYEGRLPLVHVDVYRLNTVQEVLELGFDELVGSGAVVAVEWGDVIETLLPASHLVVELSVLDGDRRRISLRGRGEAWAPRWEALEQAVAPA